MSAADNPRSAAGPGVIAVGARASARKVLHYVSFLELWERFGFHGMRVLLVLYLSAGLEAGGLGWSDSDAIQLYGIFIGLVYLMPMFGGYIADHYIGARRAVTLGAGLLLLGYALLASPAALLALTRQLTGVPIDAVLNLSGVPMAHLGLDPVQKMGLLAAGGRFGQTAVDQILLIYQTISVSFYAGLCCIVVGIGLYKPTTASIVGSLAGTQAGREADFSTFYFAINIGSFAAPIIAGGLGESHGWHVGFAGAAAGMAVCVAGVLFGPKAWLIAGHDVDNDSRALPAATTGLSPEAKRKLLLFALLSAIVILSQVAYDQSGALISLYIFDSVDRRIFGFEVPATWFQSLASLFILVLAMPLGALWMRLERVGRNPDIVAKFALAIVAMGLAFLVMTLSTWLGDTGWHVIPALILFFFLLTVSELLTAPVGFAAVKQLFPLHLQGVGMGSIYLWYSIGGLFAGLLGAFATSAKITLPVFFLTISLSQLILAAGLAVAARLLRPLLHKED